MSKLSSNLQKNENVVLEAKVHWATLILPGLLILCYGIGLIWFIPRLISFLTTELSLSNKRLVGKYGLIRTKQMDSPLNKINSISVESGLFGKLFGYATVTVNTASTVYVFKSISKAVNFKKCVLEEMDRFDETRIKEQAAAIAGALRQ